MSDLISRQAAIEAVKGRFSMPVDNLIVEVIGKLPTAEPRCYLGSPCEYQNAEIRLPTAEPYNLDEWCEDCKEYDNEKHCCPRFNRVIRTAMEEAKGEAEWNLKSSARP